MHIFFVLNFCTLNNSSKPSFVNFSISSQYSSDISDTDSMLISCFSSRCSCNNPSLPQRDSLFLQCCAKLEISCSFPSITIFSLNNVHNPYSERTLLGKYHLHVEHFFTSKEKTRFDTLKLRIINFRHAQC